MGLFSSKKKTYVATTIERVVPDNNIPDLRQKNVIKSVFENKRLTQTVINNGLQSHALKIERSYRKAARGDYYYGTPNHNVTDAAAGRDVVKNVIEAELGRAVSLDYCHFAPMNNLHVAWQRLTEEHGYDELTNTITSQAKKDLG